MLVPKNKSTDTVINIILRLRYKSVVNIFVDDLLTENSLKKLNSKCVIVLFANLQIEGFN